MPIPFVFPEVRFAMTVYQGRRCFVDDIRTSGV